MAYEPTVWKSGDVVTSAKLNKMENGIKDAADKAFIIELVQPIEASERLTKTWQEIFDAFMAGKQCIIRYEDNSEPETFVICYSVVGVNSLDLTVSFLDIAKSGVTKNIFKAETPNDYPVNDDA